MNWFFRALTSSIGKKIVMALTGLFLISFLVVHGAINAMIFIDDDGATFTHWAHFMATNPIIRTLEIVLVLGFLFHIAQGLLLWKQNRAARGAVRYHVVTPPQQSRWYSRSMTLFGTLILLFLVIHTSNFWIPNRKHQFMTGEELPLYQMILITFRSPVEVVIYLFGCFSLFWHLLHGFQSSFQSLGWKHAKYNKLIVVSGMLFSVVISVLFAMMPISVYFQWIG
ncbi:succinate dehydrogenase cytochrome b subunit [Fulvivirgaceae bacterium PWU5]|uniref:Succinate dehydrogenase cytochrome b subunit n=1 Tax=Dawidia cretensis TaxID=2782350 RepID=A0AAP2GQT0_9BACT|nr:succinate dehydrogenase cytochrome b subunit [Dawidia cretensis]MBT1710006.1 succinate dehydrogenase cytochrome b subunit [Dawidia cretensis]